MEERLGIKWPKLLILLVSLLVLPLGICAEETQNSPNFSIKLDKKFSQKQKELLARDLGALLSLPNWKSLSLEEQRQNDMTGPSNSEFLKWLNLRVKALLRHSTDHAFLLRTDRKGMIYPNPEELPDPDHGLLSVENGNQQTMMSNIGTGYYLYGKVQKKLMSADISDHLGIKYIRMPIDSPRIGVISVRESYFKKETSLSGKGHHHADRILRLSFLFHEGRHSDGHGKSLGFLHTKCPEGHDYAGRIACDRPTNGAYRVSATFLKKNIETCTDCSEKDKEGLRLAYLDAKNRILEGKILTAEERDTLNELENKMNEVVSTFMEKFQTASDEEKAAMLAKIEDIEAKIHALQNQPTEKVYWKSAPEHIKIDI